MWKGSAWCLWWWGSNLPFCAGPWLLPGAGGLEVKLSVHVLGTHIPPASEGPLISPVLPCSAYRLGPSHAVLLFFIKMPDFLESYCDRSGRFVRDLTFLPPPPPSLLI